MHSLNAATSGEESFTLENQLENAVEATVDELFSFASEGDATLFADRLSIAFGSDIDRTVADALYQDIIGGAYTLPPISILSADDLQGAQGAYSSDTGTIYLSEGLLASGDQGHILAVLLEEVGHSLDTQLNTTETPGDEGAIFSAVVRGEPLSEERLEQLRSEEDSGTAIVNGEVISVEQATIVVDTAIDELDGSIIDGDVSLRDAIASAAPGDTITFISGLTINLDSAELLIDKDLTIDGDLNNDLVPDVTINGQGASRVFNIDDSSSSLADVTLEGLTITGGDNTGGYSLSKGGGIYNAENLTITSSTVTGNIANLGGGIYSTGDLDIIYSTINNNKAPSGSGGGIHSDGSTASLDISYSTISDNVASGGGGIYSYADSLLIEHSTISGNMSGSGGGGGISSNDTTTTIRNSTISGNAVYGSEADSGGGLLTGSTTTNILNTTITDNYANYGGGLAQRSGSGTPTLNITSTIISGNTVKDSLYYTSNYATRDVSFFSSVINSGGANLIGNSDSSSVAAFDEPSDQVNVADPGLAPLADNGGPTQTHALESDSLAIDAGSNPDGLSTDQRGSGFSRTLGTATDVGAFESTFTSAPLVDLSVTPATGTEDDETLVTITATASSVVSGDQTVDLTLSGTATANDFYDTPVPTQITIQDGQTTGYATVQIYDDYTVEGLETATFTISNPSSGIALGTTLSDSVDITDNDIAGFTITESGGSTTVNESGTTDTFEVVLNARPPNDDVVLTISSDDTGEATASPITLTFDRENWNTPQEVTITGVPDGLDDGTQSVDITVAVDAASSDDAFDAVASQSITALVFNIDSPNLELTIAPVSITENGGTATGTITRTNGTIGDLFLVLSSNDTGEATVPDSVTIPDGDSSVDFTITGIDDAIIDGDQTVTITAEVPEVAVVSSDITVTDDESAELILEIAPASISEAGGIATGTVTRNTDTDTALTVTLTSDDTSEATVPTTVTIPVGETSATFIVTGIDDAIADGDQIATITASVGVLEATAALTVEDDDATIDIAIDKNFIGLDSFVFDDEVTSESEATKVIAPEEGETVTFELVVTNNGSTAASQVQVQDLIDERLMFSSLSIDDPSALVSDNSSGQNLDLILSLAPGETRTITVNTVVDFDDADNLQALPLSITFGDDNPDLSEYHNRTISGSVYVSDSNFTKEAGSTEIVFNPFLELTNTATATLLDTGVFDTDLSNNSDTDEASFLRVFLEGTLNDEETEVVVASLGPVEFDVDPRKSFSGTVRQNSEFLGVGDVGQLDADLFFDFSGLDLTDFTNATGSDAYEEFLALVAGGTYGAGQFESNNPKAPFEPSSITLTRLFDDGDDQPVGDVQTIEVGGAEVLSIDAVTESTQLTENGWEKNGVILGQWTNQSDIVLDLIDGIEIASDVTANSLKGDDVIQGAVSNGIGVQNQGTLILAEGNDVVSGNVFVEGDGNDNVGVNNEGNVRANSGADEISGKVEVNGNGNNNIGIRLNHLSSNSRIDTGNDDDSVVGKVIIHGDGSNNIGIENTSILSTSPDHRSTSDSDQDSILGHVTVTGTGNNNIGIFNAHYLSTDIDNDLIRGEVDDNGFGIVNYSLITAGAGADSFTGLVTGEGFGIKNTAVIDLDEGHDVIRAEGADAFSGFTGGGLIKLGAGNDQIFGFGDQIVHGGDGIDEATFGFDLGQGISLSSNASNAIDITANGVTMSFTDVERFTFANGSYSLNELLS